MQNVSTHSSENDSQEECLQATIIKASTVVTLDSYTLDKIAVQTITHCILGSERLSQYLICNCIALHNIDFSGGYQEDED